MRCSQPKSAPRCQYDVKGKASRSLALLGPPEAFFSAFDNVSQAYITHRLYLFSFGQPWTTSRLGRAATPRPHHPFLALLPDKRCAAWVARAEELQLETGDFVFAGGSWGLSRIHTGARRHSATRMVMDEGFAALMKTRLDGQVCPADYPRSPKVHRVYAVCTLLYACYLVHKTYAGHTPTRVRIATSISRSLHGELRTSIEPQTIYTGSTE